MDTGPLPNFSEAFQDWKLYQSPEPRMDYEIWRSPLETSKGDGYRPQCEKSSYEPIWYPHHETGPHPCQTPPPCCMHSQCRMPCRRMNTPNMHHPVYRSPSPCSFRPCGMPPWRPPRAPSRRSSSGPAARLRWLVDFRLDNIWPQPLDPPLVPSMPTAETVGHDHSYEVQDKQGQGDAMRQDNNTDIEHPPWIQNPSCPPERSVCPNEVLMRLPVQGGRPPMTYVSMIESAINEKGPLTVSGIYSWVSERFPFFTEEDSRWKNSIRHNLSLNPQFQKGEKCDNGGHIWYIHKTGDPPPCFVKQGSTTPVKEYTETEMPIVRPAVVSGRIRGVRGRGRPRGSGRRARPCGVVKRPYCMRNRNAKSTLVNKAKELDDEEELRRALKTIQETRMAVSSVELDTITPEDDEDEEEYRMLAANAQRILFGSSPDRIQEDRVRVESAPEPDLLHNDNTFQVLEDMTWNHEMYF